MQKRIGHRQPLAPGYLWWTDTQGIWTMHQLEKDYPGDVDWQQYVALYEEDYLDENAQELATLLNDHLDMAVIIYGKRGLVEGRCWITRQVPALDQLRPIDCLQSRRLIKRLRSALMRMP